MVAANTLTPTTSTTSTDHTVHTCCRHCGRAKVNRPRGLCWSCYYSKGVKERYPSTSKYANRGVASEGRVNVVPPPVPTTAAPGSEEKMAVLVLRAKRGQALWHPLDACYADDPRPLEWLRRARLT